MFIFPDISLNVFTKAPRLGQVKTRMQQKLSVQFSLDLHIQLVEYCLTHWVNLNICPITLWLAGDSEVFCQQFPHFHRLPIVEQQGKDLGERLSNAVHYQFERTRHQSHKVLLVGTDCPFIDLSYLQQACAQLQQQDMVIGPADDGGYVLLGIKRECPRLFDNISWGGDKVLAETLAVANSFNLDPYLLPSLPDIDRPADLINLQGLTEFSPFLNKWQI